jgi:hypothetical protein
MREKSILIFLILCSVSLCCLSGCSKIAIPQTGTLYISSSPRGAEVYIDNVYKGTTPVRVTDVSPGTPTVELRLNGYEIWKTTVMIGVGGWIKIDATLVPIPSPTM